MVKCPIWNGMRVFLISFVTYRSVFTLPIEVVLMRKFK